MVDYCFNCEATEQEMKVELRASFIVTYTSKGEYPKTSEYIRERVYLCRKCAELYKEEAEKLGKKFDKMITAKPGFPAHLFSSDDDDVYTNNERQLDCLIDCPSEPLAAVMEG